MAKMAKMVIDFFEKTHSLTFEKINILLRICCHFLLNSLSFYTRFCAHAILGAVLEQNQEIVLKTV